VRGKFSVFLVCTLLVAPALSAAGAKPVAGIKACFATVCVQAEIADTHFLRARGLMYRAGLERQQGMLFVFPVDGKYSFWMKNMRFPIDIIWIDQTKTVVDTKSDVPACKQTRCPDLVPQVACRYVLEVAAGFVKQHHIRTGDHIEFIPAPGTPRS